MRDRNRIIDMGLSPKTAVDPPSVNEPFSLSDEAAYAAWRDKKLRCRPRSAEDLVVTVNDLGALSDLERGKLALHCRHANLAIYECARPVQREVLRKFGPQLGLNRMDKNLCADDDNISAVEVRPEKRRSGYIPYTSRRLNWHTDGYYNPPTRRIQAFILHCVRDAERGGENEFMDPEITYLLIRDENPDFIRALMHPSVMTIPANLQGESMLRRDQSGPVFYVDPATKSLHMRYTARSRSIKWREDRITRNAVSYLTELLSTDSPYKIRYRLKPGQGVVCNNVLHRRSEFVDDSVNKRLMYRARYYDRVHVTDTHC